MASFSTTKQSVLDRINTLASNAATTAEESIYLSKALREAAFDQRFVWRGAWTQGLVYVAGDVAQYDGNAFVCTVVHTASSAFASDSAKWDTMVVGGAQWTTGSSVPANSVGEDGDWFYNTADETIHNKQGGSWTSIADLGGSRWTSSATVPANSAGEIGDFHMDTATQKIHEKTGATAWTELADLTPNADWNATSGNNGFISNKPSFKTVGGSSIIGSGDITVADTQDLSISGETLSLTNSPDVTLPTAGIVKSITRTNYPNYGTFNTNAFVNIGGSYSYTIQNTGCHLYIQHHYSLAKHPNTAFWAYSRMLVDGQSYNNMQAHMHTQNNDYTQVGYQNIINNVSYTKNQVVVFQMQGHSSGGHAGAVDDSGAEPCLVIMEIV